MPALSDLKAVTATATVDFHGIPVTVKYRPGEMTLRLERDLFDQPDDETQSEGRGRVVGAFLRIIAEWDVTGDQGLALPVSAESLEEIPRDVLWDVLRQLSSRESRGKNGASA